MRTTSLSRCTASLWTLELPNVKHYRCSMPSLTATRHNFFICKCWPYCSGINSISILRYIIDDLRNWMWQRHWKGRCCWARTNCKPSIWLHELQCWLSMRSPKTCLAKANWSTEFLQWEQQRFSISDALCSKVKSGISRSEGIHLNLTPQNGDGNETKAENGLHVWVIHQRHLLPARSWPSTIVKNIVFKSANV